MELEKPNNSNGKELQPYEEDTGKYTYDPKKGMVAPHSVEAEEAVNASVSLSSSDDDWDDDNLSEFGEGIEDDADWNDDDLADFADGIDDNADWEEKSYTFELNFGDENVMAMGQDEAERKGKELHGKLSEKFLKTLNLDEFGSDKFKDKRVWYAYLKAIDSIYSDFPVLKGDGVYKTYIEVVDIYAKLGRGFQDSRGVCSAGDILIDNKHGPANETAEDIVKDYEYQSSIGWFPSLPDENEMLCKTITHELGHQMENYVYMLKYRNMDFRSPDYMRMDDFVKKVKKDVSSIAWKIAKGKDREFYEFNYDVSDYGRKNSYEWFAETFVCAYSKKPTVAALALKEYLKENLK